MLDRDVVGGVHRIGEYFVNWYLIEEGGRLTVVDAGLPASWRSLSDALQRIGRVPGDVEALVLTHAHFDHIGFAERTLASLERIARTGAGTLLPGHREPWRGGAEWAVGEARRVGVL